MKYFLKLFSDLIEQGCQKGLLYMDIKELEKMLNEHQHTTRLIRRSDNPNREKSYSLNLRLNPENPDDAFIIKYVKGRKNNASLMRILLLAHFKTVEGAENVQ